MISLHEDIIMSGDSKSNVLCRKGCGVHVPSLNLMKHEEVECTEIPKEGRQILMKDERRVHTQKQLLLKKKREGN